MGDDVDAVFTNQRFVDLTVGKQVSGNQASRDKYFKILIEIVSAEPNETYTVDLSRANAACGSNAATNAAYTGRNPTTVTANGRGRIEAVFYLQHGQSITIENLPYGVGYTVSEIQEDYRPSLAIEGDTMTGDTLGAEDKEIKTGADVAAAMDNYLTDDATLIFTNSRIGIVPTGVDTGVNGRLPLLIVLLACTMLLGVLYLGRKQRGHA